MARFPPFIHSRPEVQLLGLHPPGFSRELVISKYVSKDTSEEADAMVENYVGFWLEVADNLVRSDHFSQVYYEQLIQAIKSSHELVLQFAANGKHKESIYMMLYAVLLAEAVQRGPDMLTVPSYCPSQTMKMQEMRVYAYFCNVILEMSHATWLSYTKRQLAVIEFQLKDQLKSLWPYTDLHHLCGVGRINPIGYDSQKMDNLMMNIIQLKM